MLTAVPTAVVAHRQAWYADKVGALLSRHGFEIAGRTDNGADGLGAVIAEQPDLLLVGDRLGMTTGGGTRGRRTATRCIAWTRLSPSASGSSG